MCLFLCYERVKHSDGWDTCSRTSSRIAWPEPLNLVMSHSEWTRLGFPQGTDEAAVSTEGEDLPRVTRSGGSRDENAGVRVALLTQPTFVCPGTESWPQVALSARGALALASPPGHREELGGSGGPDAAGGLAVACLPWAYETHTLTHASGLSAQSNFDKVF